MASCSVAGCGKPAFCRGWCSKHYTAWYRYGDPTAPRRQTLRYDSLKGVRCDCGAPAWSRYGREGPPKCRSCYMAAYWREQQALTRGSTGV